MFNETLYNGLTNIVPYWTQNVLKVYGLGNEYSMVSNIIFNELLKNVINILNYKIYVFIIVIVMIYLILNFFNISFKLNIWKMDTILLEGKEYNNNFVEYNNKINVINQYLLKNNNFKDIIINVNNIIKIQNIKDYKINNNIYLSISREVSGNDKIVYYTLSSYHQNINKFLDDIDTNFHNLSSINIIGKELNNVFEYPNSIISINNYVFQNYNFPKIKMSNINSLGCINDFEMDNIKLSVARDDKYVYYNLSSNEICCKKWLDEIIVKYNKEYKYNIEFNGLEIYDYLNYTYKLSYPKIICVLNWYLINHRQCVNYISIVSTDKIKNYLLSSDEYLIDDNIKLVVKRTRASNNIYREANTNVEYILQTNEDNIKEKLNYIEELYDKYVKNINNDDVLYHVIYLKHDGNSMICRKNILCDNENKPFESFDNIYNENTEQIKKDLDKLNDLKYYEKHGLKRKKSYLFYGEPGCGKTSTITAIAMYTKRHIIEIPMSNVKSYEHFEEIMSSDLYNTCNKSNSIYVFEEIDIGIEINNEDNNTNDAYIIYKESDKNKPRKIDLSALLTKFDGIGNYNGTIIIATTNHIDKLDKALYRNMRLTPLEFKKLRKVDCIKIIESYFGKSNDENIYDNINDYQITPTNLITLCQQHDDLSLHEFIDILKN